MKTYARPKFVREESWRYKRVKSRWRSPRGKTSRVRRSKQGWPPVVKIGYSRPTAMRGLHPSGLREITIYRPEDLHKLNSKINAARIGHTVGENKRRLILDEAERKGIHVLNPGPKKEPTVVEPSIEETEEKEPEKKPATGTGAQPETTKTGEPNRKRKP